MLTIRFLLNSNFIQQQTKQQDNKQTNKITKWHNLYPYSLRTSSSSLGFFFGGKQFE